MTHHEPQPEEVRVAIVGGDGSDEGHVPAWMLAALQPGTILLARVEAAADNPAGVSVVLRALRWVQPDVLLGERMLTGAADVVNTMLAGGPGD